MDPEGSPSARRPSPPSVEAEELADLLRQQLIAQKPDHVLAKAERWKTTRPTWSRELGAMLKADDRKPARAAALIRWLFGDQGGSEFRFVVESPKALRQKWDRIDSAMSRPPARRRPNGSYNSIATGADEDPVLNPRPRNREVTGGEDPELEPRRKSYNAIATGGDEDPVLNEPTRKQP